MGQSRPLFVYFCSFLITISIQIEKSIDGVLGIQTRGRRMVGADKTTELWRPPTVERLLDWPLRYFWTFHLLMRIATLIITASSQTTYLDDQLNTHKLCRGSGLVVSKHVSYHRQTDFKSH